MEMVSSIGEWLRIRRFNKICVRLCLGGMLGRYVQRFCMRDAEETFANVCEPTSSFSAYRASMVTDPPHTGRSSALPRRGQATECISAQGKRRKTSAYDSGRSLVVTNQGTDAA
ncbi:hypothetical protein M513_03038 [Trichuris suis]|uniref:Uncharacterized protein n=1 Tax=Trichuris suis TaxID=68888 RepID=A0A085MFB8_9BILA|nr:hypothetical protein M513_03038 [Trichuris suis]